MTDAQRVRMRAIVDRVLGYKVARLEALGQAREADTARAIAEAARDTAREELETWRTRFNALKAATQWAELESGASVAVGTRVRYMLHWYVCVEAHTKTLLRSPLNATYWQQDYDDDDEDA